MRIDSTKLADCWRDRHRAENSAQAAADIHVVCIGGETHDEEASRETDHGGKEGHSTTEEVCKTTEQREEAARCKVLSGGDPGHLCCAHVEVIADERADSDDGSLEHRILADGHGGG